MQNENTAYQETCRAAAYLRWGDPKIRFWKKVEIKGPDECWPWTGGAFRNGYGSITYKAKKCISHRLAYLFTFGEFDQSLDVCHKCDNPPCCNPSHLFLGTAKQNVQDSIVKGRFNLNKARGVKNARSKITEDQARIILQEYNSGASTRKTLWERYGVTESCIDGIIHRRTWKYISYGLTTGRPTSPDGNGNSGVALPLVQIELPI